MNSKAQRNGTNTQKFAFQKLSRTSKKKSDVEHTHVNVNRESPVTREIKLQITLQQSFTEIHFNISVDVDKSEYTLNRHFAFRQQFKLHRWLFENLLERTRDDGRLR